MRKSNIELLRVLTMMGVIILHFNNAYMGKALFYVKNGSINFYILYFIESL